MKNVIMLMLISLIANLNLYCQWEQCNGGGFNGSIQCTAVDNDIIYAGTDYGGVFISYNSGKSWTHSSLSDQTITALKIYNSVVYASTWSNGIFVSQDSGYTWTNIYSPIFDNHSIRTLDVKDNIIALGICYSNGLVLSTDYGKTWSQPNTGLTDRYIKSVMIVGTEIFMATNGQGVLRSTDKGNTWEQKNTGFDNYNSEDIYVLLNNNGILYAGTLTGIYSSGNNGNTWQKFTQDKKLYGTRAMTFIDNNIYALTQENLHLSTNNGNSWEQIYYTNENEDLTCLAAINNTLFLGKNYTGIYTSDDNFQTWTSNLSGLKEFDICSMTITGKHIFVGDGAEGIFLSTDNGSSWNSRNEGLEYKRIFSLFAKDSLIFAGCYKHLYLSYDYGEHWSDKSNGLNDSTVNCFTRIGDSIYVGTGYGIFLSTDNGENWISKLNGLNNEDFLSLDHNKGFFCTGTANGNGVYVSSDYGNSWTKKSLGNTASVYSILIDDTLIIAGTGSQGVFISSDKGDTWTQRKEGLKDCWVESLKLIDNTLFVGTLDGACTTTDFGLNWLYPGTELNTTFVHAFDYNDEYVFAATNGNGVFRAKRKDIILDVEDLTFFSHKFRITPNPANDYIRININSDNNYNGSQFVEIYNQLGEKVLSSFIGTNYEINISTLTPGIYIIKCKSMSSIFVKQ